MSAIAVASFDAAIEKVTSAVEKIKNDALQYFPEAANIGDAVRQGDVYIQLIDPVTDVPQFYKEQKNVSYPLQLAPGDTKGSRHCLEESAGAIVYMPIFSDVLANSARRASTSWLDSNDEAAMSGIKFRAEVEKFARDITKQSETEASRWESPTRAIVNEILNVISLIGPIFVLKNPGVVSHPEHGDWQLPAGCYRIVFQRTITNDNRIARVLD